MSRSLAEAAKLLQEGEQSTAVILAAMEGLIRLEPLAQIDYVSIVDPRTLEAIPGVTGGALIALAVRFGKTRLIDNMIWEG